MSLALVHSRARAGVSAPPVRVEVHLSGGLPQTHIVGLPEAAVRESRDRGDAFRLPPTAGETYMIDLNTIDDLARRLSALVPPGLRESQEELQQTFKSALQAGLSKLDLVTREEFDVQRTVLLRTREKLEALERAVAALETPASPQTPQH